MIDGVQDQALVAAIGAEVWLGEQGLTNRQPGLPIPRVAKVLSQAQQSLRSDSGRRAVYRFVRIERIGRMAAPVAELRQTGRARIPVRNAVGRSVLDIEIASGAGGLFEFGRRRRESLPAVEEFQ